ncbi:MAG: hypothetical protein EBS56_13330 [Planctomycetia bacterium]|nr:hypothetical protein [Planctomycetia bacterium]
MGTLFNCGLTGDPGAVCTRWCLPMLLLAGVVAAVGCDATGTTGTAGKPAEKQSRDVGEQVDAVMKDFKNE